jgi:8-oxo-dGTP pyrophosphatase MutT (NUDIX family)
MYLGNQVEIIYQDVDRFDSLPYDKCTRVYGLCYYKGKLVLAFENHKKEWILPGGSIEPRETFEQTLIREVKGESNMRVIKY